MTMTSFILFFFLVAEAAKTPAPTVSPDEQIQLLKLQLDEVVKAKVASDAKVVSLESTLNRIDGVNKLMDGWNKRGCKVESDPTTGLLRCSAPPELPAKVETKK